ncbi:MAG: hypothetical protein IKM05_07780 [Clostridia bacterium]|nr:hypothetical protein [Clostridia bacterium]MBR6753912.1 hypothetical protein [Clostridia bacterium]
MADKKMRFIHLAAAVILAAALCILFWPESRPADIEAEDGPAYEINRNQPAGTVERMAGEQYFPDKENWVYHFTYAYPYVLGDDIGNAMIRDTYQMALDEWLGLTLPMFANSPQEYYDGKNEVVHDFRVMCNNEDYLSILQSRSQTRGEQGTKMTLEALTFARRGEYVGESLTLRGVVMVGDSSEQIADAVWPHLYREFAELQKKGIARQDMTEKDFYNTYLPEYNFYRDENGNAVFFFQPDMLETPSFDVPVFAYSPAQLEALLNE